MTEHNKLFFDQNMGHINKRVCTILFVTTIVPVLFILLTLAGIWIVPHSYSLMLIAYSLAVGTIDSFLNRNPKMQNVSMIFGLIAATGFVLILGSSNLILISISYGLVPFLSCLYYNKTLTKFITLINYLCVVSSYIMRALQVHQEFLAGTGDKNGIIWFISSFSGATIEFFFVLLISDYISKRTHNTMSNLIQTQHEKEEALKKVMEQNDSIALLNEDLNKKCADLDTKVTELKVLQNEIIEFVAQVLGSHDLFTGQHVIHTKTYVEMIARQLRANGFYADQLTDETIDLYKRAAFLHDIGKIHIPEAVLNKMGKFTDEEFKLMQCHPEEGRKLLQLLPKIGNGKFNEIATQMAYYHHERWSGGGYPNGISGFAIPLCARIMTAADVLDALISQRLYKSPMSIDQALEVFENSSGTHFEPCIAAAVIDCRDQIEEADRKFKENETAANAKELEWWQNYHESLGQSARYQDGV